MKTNLKIDLSILDEYDDYAKANSDNWNIQSYLNMKYDINAAIAFSKFFFPDFVEREKCIILESRYNEGIFDEWYNEFNGDIEEVEKASNFYDIKDFFNINGVGDVNQLEVLGIILKSILEINLKNLFPDKKFEIYLIENYGETSITFHQKLK